MKNRTMTINIPSYKRSDAQMSTLKLFPHARLWVASFEYEKYKKNFPSVEIVKMPDSAQGLWSRARNYLLDHIDSDYFYIMDDDIQQIVYMTGDKLFPIKDPDQLEEICFNLGVVAEEWGCRMFGFNTNAQPIAAPEFHPFALNNPTTGPVSGFLKDNECRYDETVNIKSDWDMAIQQANRYGRELRAEFLSYKAKINEGTGGSAEQRNNEIEIEQLKRLRLKWGDDIVKLGPGIKWSQLNKYSTPKELLPKVKLPIAGC